MIDRRGLLMGAGGAAALLACKAHAAPGTSGQVSTRQEDNARRAAAMTASMLAAFPYERMEVAGEEAWATWLRLREGAQWPVVVGDDE